MYRSKRIDDQGQGLFKFLFNLTITDTYFSVFWIRVFKIGSFLICYGCNIFFFPLLVINEGDYYAGRNNYHVHSLWQLPMFNPRLIRPNPRYPFHFL